MTNKIQPISLRCVNPEWKNNYQYGFLLRIFLFTGVSKSQYEDNKALFPIIESTLFPIPARITFLYLNEESNWPDVTHRLNTNTEGIVESHHTSANKLYNPGFYVGLAAPLSTNNTKKESEILDLTEGLFSAIFGTTITNKPIHVGEYNFNGSIERLFATPVDTLQHASFSIGQWEQFKILIERIYTIPKQEDKKRVLLSLEYFQKGITAPKLEKFFFFWTAITILQEGTSTKIINSKLQTIFNKTYKEINDMGWKKAYLKYTKHTLYPKNIHKPLGF